VTTRREKTGIGWKGWKEHAECAMRRERQLSTCAEMEERREGKGEILNEDGREIRWMKEIEEGKDRERDEG
jgi:hypothetical protein